MPHNPDALDGLTVLHLAQPVDGGVARVVTDLAAAQVRGGARVVVACPPGGRLAEAAAAAGAETVRWSARRAPGPHLAQETTAAARILADVDPDLLHLHSAKAGLAGRLAAHGTLPTVFQPHAWSYEAARGPVAAAAVRWERYAARWTDRILCVSEAERAGGQAHGIRAAWSVVPNGVDTAHFTPDAGAAAGTGTGAWPGARPDADTAMGPAPGTGTGTGTPETGDPRSGAGPDAGPVTGRAAARAGLPALAGVAEHAPLAVCVGRLCRQKGQDVLLRAWPAVAERLPAARLVLVGDGPWRQRLAAAAPPGVLFADPADDLAPWFRAADVVVQPSRWEGMALIPLEAMACGRTVLLSDVAGARESVPPADADHCLVPPGDAPALAAALLRLLAAPQLRAGIAARALAHVRAHHDVRRTTAEVAALYARLLRLTPAPAPTSTLAPLPLPDLARPGPVDEPRRPRHTPDPGQAAARPATPAPRDEPGRRPEPRPATPAAEPATAPVPPPGRHHGQSPAHPRPPVGEPPAPRPEAVPVAPPVGQVRLAEGGTGR